jgi:peptidoglycan/LPS O-acetylase OafA/YrhL
VILTWPVTGALLGGLTVAAVAHLKRRAQPAWSAVVVLVAVAILLLVVHAHPDSVPLWLLGWIVGICVGLALTKRAPSADQSQPPRSG